MTRYLVSLPALVVAVTLACHTGPPPPGYDGPLPSDEARATLSQLKGDTLRVDGGEIAAGVYEIDDFAVIPNKHAGKCGGVLLMREDGLNDFLPLLTDGDVAEFHLRVRGSAPPGLTSERSAVNVRALGP